MDPRSLRETVVKPARDRLCGLYAVTDAALAGSRPLPDLVAQALAGGARLIQYGDKSSGPARRLAEAGALAARCREVGALLIVNDDVELALAAGANGVHVGRDDAAIASARARLGPDRLVGASCYNRFDLAVAAAAAGADYVAFGSFFPSSTKPDAVRADLSLLERARRELAVPVVAIGGITPENGGALVRAGADMLAVITAVFGAADVRTAAAALARLFDPQELP
jgi:thiamine-phosphate pyrophosphorylase